MKTIDWPPNNSQLFYNDRQCNTFPNKYTTPNTQIVGIAKFIVDGLPLFKDPSHHHLLLLLLPLLLLEELIINISPLILDKPVQWLQLLK